MASLISLLSASLVKPGYRDFPATLQSSGPRTSLSHQPATSTYGTQDGSLCKSQRYFTILKSLTCQYAAVHKQSPSPNKLLPLHNHHPLSNDAKSTSANPQDDSKEDHASCVFTAPISPIAAKSPGNTNGGDPVYQYLNLSSAGSYSPSDPWITGTSAAVSYGLRLLGSLAYHTVPQVTNNVNTTSSDATWNCSVCHRSLVCPPGFEWNELPPTQDDSDKTFARLYDSS
jgi:hypothetical protein